VHKLLNDRRPWRLAQIGASEMTPSIGIEWLPILQHLEKVAHVDGSYDA